MWVGSVHISRPQWSARRPRTLVVACSDGRLQANVDDFLQNHLGIEHYDRLFMPGGPGALSQSGHEFLRSDWWRRDCTFLLSAHQIEDVVLLFHGAASDGPADAVCADYTRKLPTLSPSQIRLQQEEDAVDVVRRVFAGPHLRVRVFRAEVQQDGLVHFVDLMGEGQPANGHR